MQNPLPAPTAQGSFLKTPFPHLLVYALERRLTGSFDLLQNGVSLGTILVLDGCPSKVRTEPPGNFLGQVMFELGMISKEQLQASLNQMQATARLQGQILLEMGATDPARLDAGLRSQVERKIEHLFGLGADTTFSYYDNFDLLQRFGGAPTPIDPFPVLWRGVREKPTWEHVDATLRRLGGAFLRIANTAQLERFAFARNEGQAIDALLQRPLQVVDVNNVIGPSLGQVLVYFLMIMKQVELVDVSQPRAPAPPPPPPTPQPTPQVSGQAFARVQLQRQPLRNPGAVVEEVAIPPGAHDERASSPAMKAPPFAGQPLPVGPSGNPPATDPATSSPQGDVEMKVGPMDIGSMISQTIQSSLPPAMAMGAPPNVPPAPPVPGLPLEAPSPAAGSAASTGSMPPVPISIPPDSGSVRELTAEQNALKTKILERADQITSQDYFQMLGLDREADVPTVQRTFIALAKIWHPDRLPPALTDVKEACSKVFSHLTEAHATLTDVPRRQEYMTLLKDGGATPDDQAKIQAILEAATDFQKAEFLLKRNPSDPQAYEMVRRCVSLDGEQADYVATLAWLDSQRPEWQAREKTLEKILILDQCIKKNANSERAYFYRGLLYKRIDDSAKALKDFKKSAELNPRNLDAIREVRLHNMRGGATNKPGAGAPAGKNPPGGPRGQPNKPAPQPEGIGGLIGKLFKK
jgi:hypothetical protein